MRRDVMLLGVTVALLATGCRTMERLSFIRPTAARGDYTQVAPTYKVSDKGRKGTAVSAGQLLANATELYRAGRMGEAEQLAQKALRIDPASADAHTLLAATAAARGAVAESGKHYQHAVALSSSGTYANNYGAWLCANGRAAESLGWFDKALADPDYATPVAAFANAGACARESGQLDLAEGQRLAGAQHAGMYHGILRRQGAKEAAALLHRGAGAKAAEVLHQRQHHRGVGRRHHGLAAQHVALAHQGGGERQAQAHTLGARRFHAQIERLHPGREQLGQGLLQGRPGDGRGAHGWGGLRSSAGWVAGKSCASSSRHR